MFQRAARANQPVVWDYHVILVEVRAASTVLVWDLDTVLPFPCPLNDYLDAAFGFDYDGKGKKSMQQLAPKFRVVPAEEYLKYFYCDRMHMFKNGKWITEPPTYALIGVTQNNSENEAQSNCGIVSPTTGSNLDQYIDMKNEGDNKGKVFTTLQALRGCTFFACTSD